MAVKPNLPLKTIVQKGKSDFLKAEDLLIKMKSFRIHKAPFIQGGIDVLQAQV